MRLLLGDCLDKLKELDDNSVDSIVTDPPYGLSFMGKKWDYDVPKKKVWKECMRVLKPGGYLLAFAGSRTYHQMAYRIEKAGFEIRDQIMWIYGSGFPKSLNIGKGIDKQGGNSLGNEVAELVKKKRLEMGLSTIQLAELGGFYGKTNHGGTVSNWETGRGSITPEQFNKLIEILNLENNPIIETKRKVLGKQKVKKGRNVHHNYDGVAAPTSEVDITKGNTEWEGWGTALKPAHEPIVMARKPLSEKTVVDNVLEWGTGGINIDDSRIGTESIPQKRHIGNTFSQVYKEKKQSYENLEWEYQVGRFPANVIFDEEAGKILDEQSGISKSGDFTQKGQSSNTEQPGGWKTSNREFKVYKGDTGGASRFFYCPKTSKTDRNEGLEDFEDKEGLRTTGKGLSNVIRKCPTHGKSIPSGYSTYECGCKFEFSDDQTVKSTKNIHPTVKPTDLMLYLIRLVTPKGGTTLDPFMGSGSTGKAAVRGGFDFVGIEMDEEYMEIATARIQYEQDNPYNEEKGERVEVNKNSQKFW